MTSFVFRIRLRDPLSNEDADRVFESIKEEVAVEEGPRGHFIGFEREAPSFLDAVLSSLSEIINLGFEPVDVEDELVPWLTSLNERVGLVNRFPCSSAVSAARETFLTQLLAT